MLRKLVLCKLVMGVAVIATLVAGVGTARLVLPWTDPARGVVKQLAFLRTEIEHGADRSAQKQFPEGYFFLNVLYGLSWVQVGLDDPARSVDATAQVRWALDRLAATDGTAPFDSALQPSSTRRPACCRIRWRRSCPVRVARRRR